jgi:hypothetical protein
MLKPIFIGIFWGVLLSNLQAQSGMNLLFRDTLTGYEGLIRGSSDYQVVDMGKDSSVEIFNRSKITLVKEQHCKPSHFTFGYDSSFIFEFNPKRLIGEMRAYSRDENGSLVHTNDTMSWTAYHTIQGRYTIGSDGIINLHFTKFIPRGEGDWYATDLNHIPDSQYRLIIKGNTYILTKQK